MSDEVGQESYCQRRREKEEVQAMADVVMAGARGRQTNKTLTQILCK